MIKAIERLPLLMSTNTAAANLVCWTNANKITVCVIELNLRQIQRQILTGSYQQQRRSNRCHNPSC
jgi:hypothetical protein